jgi:membrane fusion protein
MTIPEYPRPEDLFRPQARDQHQRDAVEARERLLVSPPWTWWLLWLVVAALAIALILSVVGSVEVNARAVGILRPGDGVRLLVSQGAGTVQSVQAPSGRQVRAGDTVLRLDMPAVHGQLMQSEREVTLLKSDFGEVARRQRALYEQQVASINARIEGMQGQIASQRTSLAAYERKWRALESLADSGVVSKFNVVDAREAYAGAARELAGTEQGIAQARQELALVNSRQESDLWQQRQALKTALSNRQALEFDLRQAVVRAPEAGTVDAVLVRPGDVVAAGSVLGKLIPKGTPLRVVSFLPEKDRAFVKVGDPVRLELQQLPYGEFGSLGARVAKISNDLAAPYEVRDALGENGSLGEPAYRVELELTDASAATNSGVRLRSGMLMQVRFMLRHQRPITMLLKPLARWFR